jgi:hypothetical protein
MPTVLRRGRLRIVIYLADHRPAHVHAIGPDGEAVFNLNCPSGPSELRENLWAQSAGARNGRTLD